MKTLNDDAIWNFYTLCDILFQNKKVKYHIAVLLNLSNYLQNE